MLRCETYTVFTKGGGLLPIGAALLTKPGGDVLLFPPCCWAAAALRMSSRVALRMEILEISLVSESVE